MVIGIWRERLVMQVNRFSVGFAVRSAAAAAAIFALSGCLVGRDYEAPSLPAPERFAPVDGVEQSSEPLDLSEWWSGFGDDTLTSLVTRAIAANHDIEIALTRVNEARAIVREARANLYPGAQVRADYTSEKTSGVRIRDGESSENRGQQLEIWGLGADALWEIDLFGRLRRAKEASDAQLDAAERNLEDALRIVAAEVAQNYMQLRSAQEQRRITEVSIEIQEETLRLVRARFEAGAVSEFDLARAQSQLSATRAGLPVFDASARAAIHRLSVLIGKAPNDLTDELTIVKPIPRYQGPVVIASPASLLRRRPDLRAAERSLHAATATSGSLEAELYPQVTFSGSLGLESRKPEDWFTGAQVTYLLGPSITWKPLDNGSIRARIAAADARAERALIVYEQSLLRALEETENALATFGAQRIRWTDLEHAVQSSSKAVQLARIQYESGATDLLTVLDAQRTLLVQRSELARSETDVATALVGIYKALGGGWEGYRIADEGPAAVAAR